MNKKRISPLAQQLRYVILDLVSGALAFGIFNVVRYYLLPESHYGYRTLWIYLFSTKLVVEQCVVPVAMLGIYWLSGYYNLPFGKSRLQELTTTSFTALINTVLIYLVLLINDQTGHRIINYELIAILFGVLFIFTYLGRLIVTTYATEHFRQDQWHFRTLIIGNSGASRIVAEKLVKGPSRVRYTIGGFVNIPGECPFNDGKGAIELEEVEETCKRLGIDQLILAPEVYNEEKVLNLVYRLFPLEIPIKISPDTFSFVTSAIRLKDIYGEPFVDLASPVMSEASRNIKRTFDVAVSILVLLVLSPLFGILAWIISRGSKGRVIYTQERIGLHQKPFLIYKFRTMYNDAEASGPQLSEANDPRITPTGRWLRKYRLDELPQFWNVLKGDMSIVGPRPEREHFIKQIVKQAPYYTLVCQVRPGITSWGMVKYGYASSVAQMVERTRYDLIYLGNMSLSVDIKILIYTVRTVVTGRGI
ncbi:MAG: sugar transferase [Muribaculaceae bacterium]|nr:sugar transferase [Muribaculaceae bacterium]